MMNNITLLRGLVRSFGGLVKALPEAYQPAGAAFLYSLTNVKVDSERPVPEEILPTLALAVLSAILGGDIPPSKSHYGAVRELDACTWPVLVENWNYPPPPISGIIERYGWVHPHYFVLGGFTATPQGDGVWLVEDRYDWHVPDRWLIPDLIVEKVPNWVLRKFCIEQDGEWYVDEISTLDKWSVPYWHRSQVRLSDYLDPNFFK